MMISLDMLLQFTHKTIKKWKMVEIVEISKSYTYAYLCILKYCGFWIIIFLSSRIKVIKEKWGQYFAIDHFYTPLCSNRNGHIVIKKFLEQKFAKSSVINLVPNAWFNDKNAIKKVRVELVFRYCLYYALWLWF